MIIKFNRDDASNFGFWIIGSGSEYRKLFDYARKLDVLDRTFFGEIYNHAEIKAILSVTDIFVCPKNLGLSVCDALASGIPIITAKDMKTNAWVWMFIKL